MRRTAITLNAVAAAFFVGFLGYTFVARQHVDALARDFVTEKTLHYSRPIVDLANASLDAPLVKRLLSDEREAVVRAEIADYRRDPPAYVADLTRKERRPAKPPNVNPLLAKVVAIKERIRTFYDDTLTALIVDLRIFAMSNLVATVLALWLAGRSRRQVRATIVGFSFLMFVAVLYCSYIYVDGLTFFRILTRAHMGWGYPLLLCFVLAGVYLDHGRTRDSRERPPATETYRDR